MHTSLLDLLSQRFAAALSVIAGAPIPRSEAQVRPAGDPRNGDYQCNAALALAKRLGAKPRELAERLRSAVDVSDLAEPLEIAGPGFINIRLTNACLEGWLDRVPPPPAGADDEQAAPGERFARLLDDRLGMEPVASPRRTVVDYSSPNIAKQMHVGHLRSSIIGDALVRVAMFEGHVVVRQNHVGDWGTQFGMLIHYYRSRPLPPPAAHGDVLAAIEADYRAAQEQFGGDPAFAAAARQAVGELQGGGAAERRRWREICELSAAAFRGVYERLGVLLTPEDVCGESFYNDRLAGVVDELRARLAPRGTVAGGTPALPRGGTAEARGPYAEVRDDAGAVCIYFYDANHQPRFRNPEGEELPMIVRKSDGAFLYATTDLAALRYRVRELDFADAVAHGGASATGGEERAVAHGGASATGGEERAVAHGGASATGDEKKTVAHGGASATSGERGAQWLVYVTDPRQKLHFEMLFAAARAAGWATDEVDLAHVTFGSVLGDNRKPLKTRTGENVKLAELLDEAERRARETFDAKLAAEPDEAYRASFSEAEKQRIARRIGIGGVKYFDLARDRNNDYVFNWDQMLALQGNTAPYMLYAYTRVRSIYRKAAERIGSPDVYAAGSGVVLADAAERALALRLARFREAVDAVAAELLPHLLCTYLYDLAADFMRFYEACPVLDAPSEAVRLSRLRLCDLTARTLRLGLGLLGIETVERM